MTERITTCRQDQGTFQLITVWVKNLKTAIGLNAWHPLVVCRYLLLAREEKIVNPKEESKPPK
jgi:hypothetical protein